MKFLIPDVTLKQLLELAAVILSIINIFIHILDSIKDKPNLSIEAIHPDFYQWWCRIPNKIIGSDNYSRIAFLAYVGISNKGRKKTSLNKWRLFISSRKNNEAIELKSISIAEPTFSSNYGTKLLPVLGCKSQYFTGETTIDSGCSITGSALFIFQSIDDYPLINDHKINGTFIISDNFKKKIKLNIVFSEVEFSFLNSVIQNLDKL